VLKKIFVTSPGRARRPARPQQKAVATQRRTSNTGGPRTWRGLKSARSSASGKQRLVTSIFAERKKTISSTLVVKRVWGVNDEMDYGLHSIDWTENLTNAMLTRLRYAGNEFPYSSTRSLLPDRRGIPVLRLPAAPFINWSEQRSVRHGPRRGGEGRGRVRTSNELKSPSPKEARTRRGYDVRD